MIKRKKFVREESSTSCIYIKIYSQKKNRSYSPRSEKNKKDCISISKILSDFTFYVLQLPIF